MSKYGVHFDYIQLFFKMITDSIVSRKKREAYFIWTLKPELKISTSRYYHSVWDIMQVTYITDVIYITTDNTFIVQCKSSSRGFLTESAWEN